MPPYPGRFNGRNAVVTGGSRGLGLAIARRLIDEGASVLIVSRSGSDLEQAVEGLGGEPRVSFVAADVSASADVDRILEAARSRWDRVDVLVNNAGIYCEAPFLDLELEDWTRVLSVNLTGALMLSQRFGRAMVEAGRGAIVNVASIDGSAAEPANACYDVSKAGLIMLTKSIAVDLGRTGVRCNSVSPGWSRTAMVEEPLPMSVLERMRAEFPRAPIGRLLLPEETAAACAFLASDEASGITGVDLRVDGGTLAAAYVVPTLGT